MVQTCHIQIGVVITSKESTAYEIDLMYIKQRNYLLDFEFELDISKFSDEHMVLRSKKGTEEEAWFMGTRSMSPPKEFVKEPFQEQELLDFLSIIHPWEISTIVCGNEIPVTQREKDDWEKHTTEEQRKNSNFTTRGGDKLIEKARKKGWDESETPAKISMPIKFVWRLWSAGLWKAINVMDYDAYETKKLLEKTKDSGNWELFNYDNKKRKRVYDAYETKTLLEELEEKESESTLISILTGFKKAFDEYFSEYSKPDFRKINGEHVNISKISNKSRITIFLYNIEKSKKKNKLDLKNGEKITNNFFSKHGVFIPGKNHFTNETQTERKRRIGFEELYVENYEYPFE